MNERYAMPQPDGSEIGRCDSCGAPARWMVKQGFETVDGWEYAEDEATRATIQRFLAEIERRMRLAPNTSGAGVVLNSVGTWRSLAATYEETP